MAVTELGTNVATGAQNVLNGITIDFATAKYEVQTSEDGGYNVDFEDLYDKDGKRMTRLVYNRNRMLSFDVICLDGAAPLTDFPEGKLCTVTGLTTFYVDSAKPKKSKGAIMVSVTLHEIFVNT